MLTADRELNTPDTHYRLFTNSVQKTFILVTVSLGYLGGVRCVTKAQVITILLNAITRLTRKARVWCTPVGLPRWQHCHEGLTQELFLSPLLLLVLGQCRPCAYLTLLSFLLTVAVITSLPACLLLSKCDGF